VKVHLSEVPIGSCFLHGKGTKKKIGDNRTASVALNGRIKTRNIKGDPEVDPVACPLKYLGVGLRRHPDQVVEIGDGNILKGKRRKS
jgi:hypothetical protein